MGERFDFPKNLDEALARLVELQTESQDIQTELNRRVILDPGGQPLRGHAYTEARRQLVDDWNEINVELRGLKLHIKGLRHAEAVGRSRPNNLRLVDRIVAVHAAGGDTRPLLDELAGQWVPR